MVHSRCSRYLKDLNTPALKHFFHLVSRTPPSLRVFWAPIGFLASLFAKFPTESVSQGPVLVHLVPASLSLLQIRSHSFRYSPWAVVSLMAPSHELQTPISAYPVAPLSQQTS